MSDWNGDELFSKMVGKTIADLSVSEDKERVDITCSDGEKFVMYHSQDCCEHVYVESISGDVTDLIGAPILHAEVVSSDKAPASFKHDYEPESQTWTFYKLATIKGSVDLRWFGSSNGYYSESVTFAKV